MSDEELIALLREKAAKGEGFYARYALPAVTVRVKPLVWRDEYQKWSADSYTATATGVGCTYIIASSTDDQNHDAVVQVKKAAAQADYEARILAALEPVAAPDPAAIREAALREALDCCTDYGFTRADECRDAILALIQKGGDAFDQADDPGHARPATSPGVTAGADAAQARPTATVSDDGGIRVMRGDAASVIEAAKILRDKLLVLVPLERTDAAQAREEALRELIDAYEDIMDYGIVFAKKDQQDRLKAAKEKLANG